MTVDGRCMKLDAPMLAKEVLVDYPNHAIFHSKIVRKFGNRAKPLQGTLALQPGQLYFLIPLPQRKDAQALGRQGMPKSTSEATPDAGQRSCATKRRVSFASSPSFVTPSGCEHHSSSSPLDPSAFTKNPSLEVLPSSSSEVVRLKVVVSKRQLAAILTEGGDSVSMVESLLTPLLKGAEVRRSDFSCSRDLSRDNSFAWRPALESIPESSCSLRLVADREN